MARGLAGFRNALKYSERLLDEVKHIACDGDLRLFYKQTIGRLGLRGLGV